MRSLRRVLAPWILSLVALSTACSDLPTAPEAPVVEPNPSLLGGVFGVLRHPVDVLHRTTPLPADETSTETIGPAGGLIRLPQAGLLVYFPPRAVSAPTRISVTAPAGDLVGYRFAPHGLRFREDVRAIQDLRDTDAGLLARLLGTRLHAAYFEGPLRPQVDALELLPFRLLGGLGVGTFEIEHFSGYVIATN